MKLLVIGGSKHGQYMDQREGQRDVVVPLLPNLLAVDYSRPSRYCIHSERIPSRRDGDMHLVTAAHVANLYGLRPGEWFATRESGRDHSPSKYCVFPDYWGEYRRSSLPPLAELPSVTISVERYRARIVSDRLVWVYVGD